jgi:HAD superfamily hydrolase (TIGR01509 family)
MIHAIIFDFDGLILETEEPTYKSWQEVYQSFGYPLPFETFSSMVGTTHGDFDPRAELERLVKRSLNWEEIEKERRVIENALIEAQPILPGVEDYLRDARILGLKMGIASNSPSPWVTKYLTQHGLQDCFDTISTSDYVHHLKPDPALYLSALNGLRIQADEAFALEDSPLGIRSAKAAGLFCVAVPNELTRMLDLSQADFKLGSLAEMPLEKLLIEINAIKTQRAAY